MAAENKVAFKISGATGAALPTLDIGFFSTAGAEITSIEGILNGTTNYILTRMKEGSNFQSALKEAQEKGIAEPDPSLDIVGWDTAYKMLLISNSLLNIDISLDEVKVTGIRAIPQKLVNKGREKGKSLKLLGILSGKEGNYQVQVKPEVIDENHPLYNVNGTEKGIVYHTDTMSSITVSGGKSDPLGAAASLLKDIIHIYYFSQFDIYS